jgi:hypothetical protein
MIHTATLQATAEDSQLRFIFQTPSFKGHFDSDAASAGLSLQPASLRTSLPKGEHEARRNAVVPTSLERHIKQWALSQPAEPCLVLALDAATGEIPWERLPVRLGLPTLMVARLPIALVDSPSTPPVLRAVEARLVVAGCSVYNGIAFPGIDRELQELRKLACAQLSVDIIPGATLQQLRDDLRRQPSSLVHLALPGVVHSLSGVDPSIVMGSVEPESDHNDTVDVDRLVAAIKHPELRLVLLNACRGDEFARLLTERLGVPCVSWLDTVDDHFAADFAMFFYRRLMGRERPVQALRALRQQFTSIDSVPVLWVPSVGRVDEDVCLGEDLASRLSEGPRREYTVRGGGGFESYRGSSDGAVPAAPSSPNPVIRLQFQATPAINPALLKNRRPVIERLVIETDRDCNARLELRCDVGGVSSSHAQTVSLRKGEQRIEAERVIFPALYELIERRAPRRYVNLIVRVEVDGQIIAEATESALWMSAAEWMDSPETWPFITSFIDPLNAGVSAVIAKAGPVLKAIESPTASFSGYQANDVAPQLKAIFQTLRDEFKLVYVNPPAGPVYVPGARVALGQLVRPADEVVNGGRGTCHDLALLYAGCAENVGIHAVVVLIPGHTFVGCWRSSGDHREFWGAKGGNPTRSNGAGDSWMIRDVGEFGRICDKIEFLESTFVTDRNAQYKAAVEEGNRKARAAIARSALDVVVDVSASRIGVMPV